MRLFYAGTSKRPYSGTIWVGLEFSRFVSSVYPPVCADALPPVPDCVLPPVVEVLVFVLGESSPEEQAENEKAIMLSKKNSFFIALLLFKFSDNEMKWGRKSRSAMERICNYVLPHLSQFLIIYVRRYLITYSACRNGS